MRFVKISMQGTASCSSSACCCGNGTWTQRGTEVHFATRPIRPGGLFRHDNVALICVRDVIPVFCATVKYRSIRQQSHLLPSGLAEGRTPSSWAA